MVQFQGNGSVMEYGKEIARVRYDLTKTISRIGIGRGKTPTGISRTEGLIKVIQGAIIFGYTYMLRLENGKEVEFYTSHEGEQGLSQPTYSISVNGDPGK